MKFNKILVILLLVVCIGVGAFFYTKNIRLNQETHAQSAIPEYLFSTTSHKNLTQVTLSQHTLSFKSPWGAEKSFKGGEDLTQYTFANGVNILVSLSKLSPKEELENEGMSASDEKIFNSVLGFVASKIGPDFGGYDYRLFLLNTTQATIDAATTTSDKDGYVKTLALKALVIPSSDNIFRLSIPGGKGLVAFYGTSTIPSIVDVWNQNNWLYRFSFPSKENISKVDIDTIVTSLSGF